MRAVGIHWTPGPSMQLTWTRGFATPWRVALQDWSKSPLAQGLIEKIARRWAVGDVLGGDKLFTDAFGDPGKYDLTPLLKGR